MLNVATWQQVWPMHNHSKSSSASLALRAVDAVRAVVGHAEVNESGNPTTTAEIGPRPTIVSG